jgi:hypothetical protein
MEKWRSPHSGIRFLGVAGERQTRKLIFVSINKSESVQHDSQMLGTDHDLDVYQQSTENSKCRLLRNRFWKPQGSNCRFWQTLPHKAWLDTEYADKSKFSSSLGLRATLHDNVSRRPMYTSIKSPDILLLVWLKGSDDRGSFSSPSPDFPQHLSLSFFLAKQQSHQVSPESHLWQRCPLQLPTSSPRQPLHRLAQ